MRYVQTRLKCVATRVANITPGVDMSFRHTTKQYARSQDVLRSRAVRALDEDRQILCKSVYMNTYGVDLPPTSVDILSNIVSPLTGHAAEPTVDRRSIFTVCAGEYSNGLRFRVCFLQPEVSSATAQSSSMYASSFVHARADATKALNNPAPGGIHVSAEKCQVTGRLAPYTVSESGLAYKVEWTYCNASKSRFIYLVTSGNGTVLMSPTRATISVYQSFCADDCAIVYMSSMRCFKVTASPSADDQTERANKSTCIFLYCDGSFKVAGTPHKAYKVCRLMRETMLRAHSSYMHAKLIETLVPSHEAGA